MITIEDNNIVISEGEKSEVYDISTPEAFRILSNLWLRSGWDTDNKYVYSFTPSLRKNICAATVQTGCSSFHGI